MVTTSTNPENMATTVPTTFQPPKHAEYSAHNPIHQSQKWKLQCTQSTNPPPPKHCNYSAHNPPAPKTWKLHYAQSTNPQNMETTVPTIHQPPKHGNHGAQGTLLSWPGMGVLPILTILTQSTSVQQKVKPPDRLTAMLGILPTLYLQFPSLFAPYGVNKVKLYVWMSVDITGLQKNK